MVDRLLGGMWTPEDDYPAMARDTYGPQKEWDVIIVNDKRTANAAASPGGYIRSLSLKFVV
jgi:hypothetical protein